MREFKRFNASSRKVTMGLMSWIIFLATNMLNVSTVIGQEVFEKTFQKAFKDKNYLKINHRNGPIEILPASDNQIRITAEISMKARTHQDAQKIFDHFELEMEEEESRITVHSIFATRQWQNNNGQIKIEFEDRAVVEDIKDLNIQLVVYLPKISHLVIANRYGNIKIAEDTYKDLDIELYNGNLEIPDVTGEFNLTLKYGKAEIGDIKDGSLELYDSKLIAGDGNRVLLKSKYSEFELGDFEDLSIDSYDDNLELGDVKRLSIKDKYSEYEIKDFKDGRMDLYDATIFLGDGSTLKLKSKYSKLVIGDLTYFDCEFSYDDKITIGRLEKFLAASKYTDFKIGQLKTKFIVESYDDNLDIGWVSGPLEEITFNGKYTDLTMSLPENSQYLLEAITQYGKFNYPKSKVEYSYYFEKDDKIEFKGKVKGSSDDSPKIKINSYDGKIVLN